MADIMSALNALYNAPEKVRARDRRRSQRKTEVYDRIGGKLREAIGGGRMDQLARLAREKRGLDGWSLPTDPERHLRIGNQHPGAAAVGLVYEALSDFDIPTPMNVRFAGMKRVKGHPPYFMEEGHVLIKAELQSLSSVKHHITIPVVVKKGKMLYPGVLFHKESPRVMAQNTFDEILGDAEIMHPARDRAHVFSTPDPNMPPIHEKYPVVQTGLFGAHSLRFKGQKKQASKEEIERRARERTEKKAGIQDALRGFRRAASPPHLDPAERPVDEGFGAGENVTLAREVMVHDRGGVSYTLTSGTKGRIIRDIEGDHRRYYVEFPDEGFKAVIHAQDLR